MDDLELEDMDGDHLHCWTHTQYCEAVMIRLSSKDGYLLNRAHAEYLITWLYEWIATLPTSAD